MQQERQVLVAARRQKFDNFLVRLDGFYNLRVAQGPALVLVDELEALARGVFELRGEIFNLTLRGGRVGLALQRALRELVGQRLLDGVLPASGATGESDTVPRRRRRKT